MTEKEIGACKDVMPVTRMETGIWYSCMKGVNNFRQRGFVRFPLYCIRPPSRDSARWLFRCCLTAFFFNPLLNVHSFPETTNKKC